MVQFAVEANGLERHFGSGDAVVESVCVIPAPTGSITAGAHDNVVHDQVWMIVKRTIDGKRPGDRGQFYLSHLSHHR